nr:asparagine synthase [Alkaliphilus hydrothermalis]
MIPTLLGTGVTATGVVLKGMAAKRESHDHIMPMVAAGIIGFGLAHVLLGTIDLVDEDHHR